MTYKQDHCAELGLVDVFQFESDSVKPISCKKIKVIMITFLKLHDIYLFVDIG